MNEQLTTILWGFYGIFLGVICIILSKLFKSFKHQIIGLLIFTVISIIIILLTDKLL